MRSKGAQIRSIPFFAWCLVLAFPLFGQDIRVQVADSLQTQEVYQRKPRQVYSAREFYAHTESWLRKMEDQGYPFAYIQFTWDSLTGMPVMQDSGPELPGSLDLKAHWGAGPFMAMDSFVFWGDHGCRPMYLRGLTGLRPGQAYSESGVRQSLRRINRQEHVSLVAPPVVYFTTRGAVVGYGLRSRSSSWADLILGFKSRPQGGVEFNGQGQISLKNQMGHGEDMHLNIHWLPIGSRTMDLRFKFPWPWGLPVIPSGSLHLLKQDTSWMRVRYGASLGYLARPGWELSWRVNREVSLVSARNIPGVEEYKTLLSGIGMEIQESFPLGNPYKGWEGLATLDGGIRRSQEANGQESNAQIWNAQAKGAGFLGIRERHVLRPGFQLEQLQGTRISRNQWTILGGTNGLRGTSPYSLPARRYAILNMEYRYRLDDQSHLYAGYLRAQLDNTGKDLTPYEAVFAGFRILLNKTRLDLGYSMGRFLPGGFSPDKGLVDIGLRNYF